MQVPASDEEISSRIINASKGNEHDPAAILIASSTGLSILDFLRHVTDHFSMCK